MAFLRFDSVSFAYPDAEKRALDEISFSMEKGEYVVVCGESGCGKTTLLRHAKPELTPAGARAGQIYYQDTELKELPQDISAMKIGYVQQNPDNQIVTDFVWHELAFGLENMALPTREIRRRVSEMASFFGMEEWFHKKTCELSGGQKQMLNLASIMAMDPELLILDEPTSMLDPLASINLLQMVRRINRELGVSVLLCEHQLEDVFQAADRVLLMRRGRILADGAPGSMARAVSREEFASSIYYGLPGAVRIFGELQKKGLYPEEKELPLSVRDARRELAPLKLDPEAVQVKSKADGQKDRDTVLAGREIWFRYTEKSQDVLRGLTISLKKGELLTLLGGNGSGKSTLLKILSGIERPLRGKVKKDKHIRLAMLPQSPQALFTHDTLWEDLLDSAGKDAAAAEDMARQMYLADRLTLHPFDLSGGELQRAAIGKLLLHNADVLLMDEPTKGLDAYLKRELAALLKSLTEKGISILMVTHDLEFAASWADRCALLFDGQITSEDEPHRFFSGNRFYTTAANRIAGERLPGAITCEEILAALTN